MGDEYARLSFERRSAVLWSAPPASVGTAAAYCCYVRAGRCRAVRTERCRPTGKVSLVRKSDGVVSCTAVCKVRRMDARQMHAAVDSGCDENVHQMCELPNYAVSCNGSHGIVVTLG